MPVRDDSKTSLTLLGRLSLSPPDQASWNEFVDRHGPKILQWCDARGLQEADILDVSQAVLSKLAVELRRFHYDPTRSFRNWLRAVVSSGARDATRAKVRDLERRAPVSGEMPENIEDREDLVRRLEREFDLELLEIAIRIVRERIASKTRDAYVLTDREGCPTTEAAARLGMKIGAVYQAKSNVARLLQQEIQKLEGDSAAH